MKFLFTFFLLFNIYVHGFRQHVSVVKLENLEERIQHADTIYIINFWATWCVPCVKELPAFDSIQTDYKDKKVKVLLVSLDFKEDLESKLKPFIISKKVQSEVLLLDETNSNYFIPRLSSAWTGAIPATIIRVNPKNYRIFYERKLDYTSLNAEIERKK